MPKPQHRLRPVRAPDAVQSAKAVGFDLVRVAKPCETDCSCAGAGLPGIRRRLRRRIFARRRRRRSCWPPRSLWFPTDKKYTDSSDYLRRGDVLVTRTQGHTVVVLSNGSKADSLKVEHQLGDRLLKKGMSGSDVRELRARRIC